MLLDSFDRPASVQILDTGIRVFHELIDESEKIIGNGFNIGSKLLRHYGDG